MSCGKSRTRFSELTKIEKGRQFGPRLAYALSALLHVAAMSSINYQKTVAERKKKRRLKGGKRGKITEEEEKIFQKELSRDVS